MTAMVASCSDFDASTPFTNPLPAPTIHMTAAQDYADVDSDQAGGQDLCTSGESAGAGKCCIRPRQRKVEHVHRWAQPDWPLLQAWGEQYLH